MFDIAGYYEAASISDAIAKLQEWENGLLISGGTDVLIKARERKQDFVGRSLIGITRIEELKEISINEEGNIFIGAACNFTAVEKNATLQEHVPALSAACGTVGGPQVRNMGTIGGNVCNGATSADSATMLFALNAILIIESGDGRREVSIHDFYLGPGRVALNHDDILIAIKITKENYEGMKGHYIKFAQRQAMDIANLGCSIVIKEEGNIIKDLRIAFGVAGPTPLRAKAAEAYAVGKEINPENLQEIGRLCLEDTKARDSWRASKAFREHLIQELPGRAIMTALGRARTEGQA